MISTQMASYLGQSQSDYCNNNHNKQSILFVHGKFSEFAKQPHKGHLTSKVKYRRFLSYLLCPLLLLPFHLLPSLVHPTGFSFCFIPVALVIFSFFSSNNNNQIYQQPPNAYDSMRIITKPARYCEYAGGDCKYYRAANTSAVSTSLVAW